MCKIKKKAIILINASKNHKQNISRNQKQFHWLKHHPQESSRLRRATQSLTIFYKRPFFYRNLKRHWRKFNIHSPWRLSLRKKYMCPSLRCQKWLYLKVSILLNEERNEIYVTHTKEKRLIPLIYKDFKSIFKTQQLKRNEQRIQTAISRKRNNNDL